MKFISGVIPFSYTTGQFGPWSVENTVMIHHSEKKTIKNLFNKIIKLTRWTRNQLSEKFQIKSMLSTSIK